jgi:hypothetical protein
VSATSTSESSASAALVQIRMRRRSCRSANAPAIGMAKISGPVVAKPVAVSARASCGFCVASG